MEKLKAEQVVKLLMERKWHISMAESCTGGMVTACLVEVANASAVLDASIVTYANEAKMRYLGVQAVSIEREGVVSELVAGEMAAGAAKANHAEVGVGITGIAGPTGGSRQKPVGMVCFGFWIRGKLLTFCQQFGEIGRTQVRQASTDFVYQKLEELLKNEKC